MKHLLIIYFLINLPLCNLKLPNDLRWVKNSKEYTIICESIFELAYKNILEKIESPSYNIIDYDIFLSNLKKSNEMNISTLTCSTKECYGTYINRPLSRFKVIIPKLSNSFLYQVKKNNIDYTFMENLEVFKTINNFAIVVDLDETILDNSDYQVMLNDLKQKYNPESWSNWVNEEKAETVPGAKKFLDNVRNLDITIIFLSNRMDKNLLPTKRNMDRLELLSENDIFLLRLDKSDTKVVRRQEIYSSSNRMSNYPKFDIISYLGDAYGDFPKDSDMCSWGYNCHVFPNPMYGKW